MCTITRFNGQYDSNQLRGMHHSDDKHTITIPRDGNRMQLYSDSLSPSRATTFNHALGEQLMQFASIQIKLGLRK